MDRKLVLTVTITRFCDNPDWDNLSDEEFTERFEGDVRQLLQRPDAPDITVSSTWVWGDLSRY